MQAAGQHPHPSSPAEWLPALQSRLRRTLAQARENLRRLDGSAGQLDGFGVEDAMQVSWSAVLTGPAAPFELLARLAGVSIEDVLTSPGSSRSGGVPRRLSASDSQSAAHSADIPPDRAPSVRHQPEKEVEPPAVPEGIAPQPVRGSEFTPLAPPAATVSLPPLSAPQKPYDPTLPAAAATLRYGAHREQVDTAPEDLDRLAEQIKRILDEEARRHGIRVP